MLVRMMQLFINSSELFVTTETDLILSGVSERCLCGSFMVIMTPILKTTEFRGYYADIEYNRNFDGKIKTIIDDNMEITNFTCDLIIHSRGLTPHLDNLIAIEMKRDNHLEIEKNKDRIRLRALTKPTNDSMTYSVDGRALPQHVCGYKLGVFYEVSVTQREINIEYFANGMPYTYFRRSF